MAELEMILCKVVLETTHYMEAMEQTHYLVVMVMTR
jgi:hypothetical protein